MTAPTYATLTTSLTVGGTGQPSKGIGRSRHLQYAELDIAAAVAAGLTTTQSVKLINIPAFTKVVIHEVRNLTTLVGTSFAVGDSTDEALFVAADSTTTLGHEATITAAGLEPGTKYVTANFINVKLTVPTSGTLGFWFELIDLTRDQIALVP